jgi:hypothetical protein
MSTISYRHNEHLQGAQIAAALAATGFVALGIFQLALALALANFASQSHWESYLLGPTAVVLAVLCVMVARSPMTSR